MSIYSNQNARQLSVVSIQKKTNKTEERWTERE